MGGIPQFAEGKGRYRVFRRDDRASPIGSMETEVSKIEEKKDPEELFGILLNVLRLLRSPEGCMWDRDQDHQSIKKNLIEEAYEALEAIEEKNYPELMEEMGDITLQVVFHSQIASEEGHFDISDVLKSIILKLIRRHPHVFMGKEVKDSEEVLTNWEEIKKNERKLKELEDQSIFSNIPKILPALHYAFEVQNRASRLGFDWDRKEEVLDKIEEELKELETEINKVDNIKNIKDEIGDMLFSVVNLCRHLDIDSEECLKKTCRKFIGRFNFMEEHAKKNNIDFKMLSLKEKDELWDLAKKNNY
jgi:tetrapyrrole methylase family protein / MazG family protein